MSQYRNSTKKLYASDFLGLFFVGAVVLTIFLGICYAVFCANNSYEEKQKAARTEIVTHDRIENIEMVFIHERNGYSVMVNGKIQPILPENTCLKEALFLFDIPNGQPNYLTKTLTGDRNQVNVVFHLRDHQSINGAGWNHGKFGSGQTTIIEQ